MFTSPRNPLFVDQLTVEAHVRVFPNGGIWIGVESSSDCSGMPGSDIRATSRPSSLLLVGGPRTCRSIPVLLIHTFTVAVTCFRKQDT